jgi:hypothetical protein
MAAKLASKSTNNQIWVSDRFYRKLTGDKARMSCGCGSEDGQPMLLWHAEDVSQDSRFDFDRAMVLRSNWCATHGKQFLREIVRYDG